MFQIIAKLANTKINRVYQRLRRMFVIFEDLRKFKVLFFLTGWDFVKSLRWRFARDYKLTVCWKLFIACSNESLTAIVVAAFDDQLHIDLTHSWCGIVSGFEFARVALFCVLITVCMRCAASVDCAK
jgi:hypothetical protein